MNTSFPILLVEDNPDDVFFVERAFLTADIKHPLVTVGDGQEAIHYLSRSGKYGDRAVYCLPGLVLADIKMPRVTGFDLIAWMRNDDHWRLVPIIILSSSGLAVDVNRAYELGANAYMVKPAGPRSLARLFRTIAEFWLAGEEPASGAVARGDEAVSSKR
jgi:CheY-like chemotaxis protein